MKRKTYCAVLLLAALLTVSFCVPSALSYLIDQTPAAENTFVIAPILREVEVPIEVHDSVINLDEEKTIGPEGFRYVLTNERTGGQYFAVSDQDGVAVFTLFFSGLDAGTHDFTLRECGGDIPGVVYDDTVYHVQVTVTMGDVPTATVTVNGQPLEGFTIVFVNTYFGKIPHTGDAATPMIWAGAMLLSAAAIAALLIMRKRANA